MTLSEVEESSIEEDSDEKIKLMILGDSNIGKSSLLNKYCKNEFNDKYKTTLGINFQIKYLNINNKKNKITNMGYSRNGKILYLNIKLF